MVREDTHTHRYTETQEEQKSNAKLMVWITNEMYHFALAKPFAKRAGSLARRGVSASSLQHGRKKLPATILLVFLERGSSRLLPRRDGGSTKRGGRRSGWVNSPTIPSQVLIFGTTNSTFEITAILHDFAFHVDVFYTFSKRKSSFSKIFRH